MHTATRLLTAAILAALSTSALAAGPAERALGHLRANSASVKGSTGDVFLAKRVVNGPNGIAHVRFERTYHGLPVIGGDFITHERTDGSYAAPSLTLKSAIKADLNGRISADEATLIAGTDFGTGFDSVSKARKVIFALDGEPTLAWEVQFEGSDNKGGPKARVYYVGASNGHILRNWSLVETGKPGGGGSTGGTAAVGTGKTYTYGNVVLNTALSGTTYNLTDTTRGGGSTWDGGNVTYSRAARGATLFTDADNIWGNNDFSTDRATDAAQAHYGVAATWDYYKNTFGRLGIFNDNKGAKSYVHVGSCWGNAAWYANAMYYGDACNGDLPFTALDVAGHEMSHGVNQAEAGLVYSGDSGGLNEGNSDIFGTMVEYYANNANDVGDYRIGEEIYANESGELRRMWAQSADGYSFDCYPGAFSPTNDYHDPHFTSGVTNHWFYLLAEGTSPAGGLPASKTCAAGDSRIATGNGSLAGIGKDKAQRIWYLALTSYLTSNSSFPGARTATLNAARDLYGNASAEYNAVAAAWTAVKVN